MSEFDTAILKAGLVARTPAASASSSAALTQVYELRRGATGGSSNKPVLPVENSSSTTEGVNFVRVGEGRRGYRRGVPPADSSRRVGTAELRRRRRGGARGRRSSRRFRSNSCPPLHWVLLVQSLAAAAGSFLRAAILLPKVRRCGTALLGTNYAQPARCASRKSAVFSEHGFSSGAFNCAGRGGSAAAPLGTAPHAFGASSRLRVRPR